MIKASELRLGNYINSLIGEVIGTRSLVVVEINHIKHISEGNKYNYEPIPLTPEILESAGFEIDFHDGRDTYHKRCYLLHLETFTVTQELNGFYFGSPGESSEWYTPMGTEIKYVHQLQNLYHALTGLELEIKAMAPSASHTS